MPMSPRLLRPIAARSGFNFNPANLTLVYDTSLEPANNTISFPVSGAAPNVTINWGDGTSETQTTTGFKTHTYANPGVYVVQVSGAMTALDHGTGASTTNNKAKLVRCLSFGEIGLVSLVNGFRGCSNLVQCPTSLPTTSVLTSLANLFFGCSQFNDSRIAQWNTANIMSLEGMFENALAFNQPIGSWNTGSVTTTRRLFQNAPAFNQPIGSWATGQVTSMVEMFQVATAFNQDISNWNTGNVRNMASMFNSAPAFNQPIGGWDVSRVAIMQGVFFNATAFSQDISGWDIRKVVNMGTMFNGTFWGTANYDAALNAWADLADTDLTIGTTTNTSQAITAFATLSSGTQTRVTSNGHGLVAGSRVNISGTTNYNGDYNVLAVGAGANPSTFDIAQAFVANDATGTMKHRRSRNITAGFGANKYSAGAPTTARGVLTTTYDWSITDGGQA